MIILKVDGDGTLSIQDPMYDEINRYDAYEINESDLDSKDKILSLCYEITALCQYIQDFSEDYGDNEMNDYSTDDVEKFFSVLSDKDFKLLSAYLKDWFNEEPDGDEETLSYNNDVVNPLNGYDAAYRMFSWNFGSDDIPDWAEDVGIKTIEGDSPGSSYYAAVLEKDIDEANSIALKNSYPVKFIT